MRLRTLNVLLAATLSISGCGDDEECETLPERIESDMTVAGCAIIDRTEVRNGATLTIEPGTTVKFRANGYLAVNDLESGAALVAESSESEEPIFFTSAAAEPEPGDWQCVRIDKGSTRTSIIGAEFEFGGAPCEATGSDPEGMLVLNSEIARVHRAEFRLSSSHGLFFERDGRVTERVEESRFASNAKPAIRLGLNAVLSVGADNIYQDPDDYIAVDTVPALETPGEWMAQGVPFRLLRDDRTDELDAQIRPNDAGPVTITAGTIIQLDNGTLNVLQSTLLVEGSESDPVVFTSAEDDPAPGDWGCILIAASVENAPSSIDHAIVEFAGNGVKCTGAKYTGAIVADDYTTTITNTTFRELGGAASIMTGGSCPDMVPEPGTSTEGWCRVGNNFDDSTGEIACEYDMITNCVLDS